MALSNPSVLINGTPFPVLGNSVSFTEGQPEATIRTQIVGNNVVQDYTENFETAMSVFKCSFLSTAEQIEQVRAFRQLKNTNIITLTATETVSGVESPIRRTFTNASITNQYEVALGSDVQVDLEWMSDQAT